MDKVKEEIQKAVEALGHKGTIDIYVISFNRYRVFIEDLLIGIYDLDKHTFID